VTPDTPKAGFVSRLPKDFWRNLAIGVGVVVVLAIAIGLVFGNQPGFFNRYAEYHQSAATLAVSQHKGLSCTQCHVPPGSTLGYQAALVGDFWWGLFGKPYSPTFVKFGAPARQMCVNCHNENWSDDSAKTSKIPHPAHLRVATETRDCSTCHRWVGHEENIQVQHQKMPFSVVCAAFGCHVGTKPIGDCQNCHHQMQPSLDAWKQTHPQVVRAYGPNACLEQCHTAQQCQTCHTTGKTPQFSFTLNNPVGVSDIEAAHVKTSTWLTQHGTFALKDGQQKCLTCHITTQECQDCHSHRPAFHGTDNTWWIGNHKNVVTDKRRCYECHNPKQCNDCHAQFKQQG
jgi:hypothetical protein